MLRLRLPVLGQLVRLSMPPELADPFSAYMVEWGVMTARRSGACQNPGGVAWTARARWIATGAVPARDRDDLLTWLENSRSLPWLRAEQVTSLLDVGSCEINGVIVESGADHQAMDLAKELGRRLGGHGLPDPDGRFTEILHRDGLTALMSAGLYPPVTQDYLTAAQFAAHRDDWF